VVHIAGLGHANHRVEQQVRTGLVRGALGELLVRTVHGIAGLEGHHIGITHMRQQLTHFSGSTPQFREIEVLRHLEHLERPAEAELAPGEHLTVGGVFLVGASQALGRLFMRVGFKDLIHAHPGNQVVIGVAQGDFPPFLNAVQFGDGQGDGDGPDQPVSQPHVVQHAVIIGLAHKAVERGEPAKGQQFQIAQTARRQLESGSLAGTARQIFALAARNPKIDQFAAVRRIQFDFIHGFHVSPKVHFFHFARATGA